MHAIAKKQREWPKTESFTDVSRAEFTLQKKLVKFFARHFKNRTPEVDIINFVFVDRVCLWLLCNFQRQHQKCEKDHWSCLQCKCSFCNLSSLPFLFVKKVKELQINHTFIEIAKSFVEKCLYFEWLLCPNKCWLIKSILVYWQS